MRNNDQILAEVLDSLIKQDSGKIPAEVGELVELGLRLHNECPDIDPAFMDRLGRRLDQEWTALEQAHLTVSGLPAPLAARGALKIALRVTAAVAVAVAVISVVMTAIPGMRSSVEAGLSRVITLFPQTKVEQQPRLAAGPWPSPEAWQRYPELEQVRAATGFNVRLPSYLPHGLDFEEAEVIEGQGQTRVIVRYGNSDGFDMPEGAGRRSLLIHEFLGTQTPEQVAISLQIGLESAQSLRVAGRPALWVAGYWGPTGIWTRGGKGGVLMVQDADVFLVLYGSFGRIETVRVAESLFK